MAAYLAEARLLLFPNFHSRMLLMYFDDLNEDQEAVLVSL